MIEQGTGNLLNADADALVNTVNCVGVMGKGIALQFKQAFPENFNAYAAACRGGDVLPGRMFIHETKGLVGPKWIINFPTKKHWKGKSRLADIETGLRSLVADVRRLGIRSIAVPPLGCGNGGLEWTEVRPLIVRAFAELPDVRAIVFEPGATPAADAMPNATERPSLTRARALLIRLIEAYARPGYTTTLLEVQKLAYFLQEAGEPLRLKFDRGPYGPYAHNLNHVLERLEGHYLRGLGDRSGSRHTPIALVENAGWQAQMLIGDDRGATARFARIAALIEGFETPYGMELLSTVHWVVRAHPDYAKDPSLVIDAVHAWNDRKRRVMQPPHVELALDQLATHGWVS